MNTIKLNCLNSIFSRVSGKRIGQIVLWLYFVLLTVIYPYYAPGGYLRIGEMKYLFFRNVTLLMAAVMFVIIVCVLIPRPGLVAGYYHRMSVTDWFAYGYFVTVMLSYLCSAYKKEAFWGAEGWYMGTVMQMLFVLLYFFFSRYFVCDGKWPAVWMTGSVGVFILGILNRYSIYPFAMEGQTPVFISTLGNINWFCGYWSVTAPVGITLYWCSEKRWCRLLAGFYSLVAMLAGVVQGSESAYLVFGAVCAVLLLFSIHSVERLYRWMGLCMIWLAGCQLGRLMRYLPGLRMNYGSAINGGSPSIMERLTDSNDTLWILGIMLTVYIIFRVWNEKGDAKETEEKDLTRPREKDIAESRGKGAIKLEEKDTAKLRGIKDFITDSHKKTVCIVAVTVFLVLVAVWVLYASDLLYQGTDTDASAQDNGRIVVFNEDWGNGRGVAWNCSIEAYKRLDPLHKIVGVGPDCFANHIYGDSVLAVRLVEEFGQERLTNAHNEGLSILINLGLLGALCYAGLVGSLLLRCCRRAQGQQILYVCAVSILAYTVHNVVSFQQVLNTPYLFILLGIGEGLLRKSKEKA